MYFIISVCDCETIFVSLKKKALVAQGKRGGVYRKSSEINKATSWISNSQAIWQDPKKNKWVIGPKNKIGSVYSAMASKNGFSCPFDVPSKYWKYVDKKKWKNAGANEIYLICFKGLFFKIISKNHILSY